MVELMGGGSRPGLMSRRTTVAICGLIFHYNVYLEGCTKHMTQQHHLAKPFLYILTLRVSSFTF